MKTKIFYKSLISKWKNIFLYFTYTPIVYVYNSILKYHVDNWVFIPTNNSSNMFENELVTSVEIFDFNAVDIYKEEGWSEGRALTSFSRTYCLRFSKNEPIRFTLTGSKLYAIALFTNLSGLTQSNAFCTFHKLIIFKTIYNICY